MTARRKPKGTKRSGQPRAFPFSDAEWNNVVGVLDLSPQQAKIVALILRGMKDKEISSEMELSVATVRTYLTRIFQRATVNDRVGLVLVVFAICRDGDHLSSK